MEKEISFEEISKTLKNAYDNDLSYAILIKTGEESFRSLINGSSEELLAMCTENIDNICDEIDFPKVELLKIWLKDAKKEERMRRIHN